MDNQWNAQTVGDIVTRLPAAAEVFKARGIDFCCGGHRPLALVVRDQGIDEAELITALDKEEAKAKQIAATLDFTGMEPRMLSSYIEGRHHSYLREALPEISVLLNAVLKAHGRNHPELFEIHKLFGTLRTDLEQHLIKEETILFPMVAEHDNDDAVHALTQEIKAEHEAAGKVLKELRHITQSYQTPADGCMTYKRLMDALVKLESDLFQHIHLENNILLKDM